MMSYADMVASEPHMGDAPSAYLGKPSDADVAAAREREHEMAKRHRRAVFKAWAHECMCAMLRGGRNIDPSTVDELADVYDRLQPVSLDIG